MCAAYSDAQVQEIIAERDGLYQTLAREVANVASATTRYMEAEAERARLQALVGRMRDALTQALETIRTWHGMRLRPEEEPDLWSLYKVGAPEMQPILAVLVDPEGQRVEAEWRALLEAGDTLREHLLVRTYGHGVTMKQPRIPSVDKALATWDAAVERARQP